MNHLKISIIIPVYNAQKYLSEAIDSIIDQAIHPSEIIVVDDASTDASIKVASRYGSQLTLLKHKTNRGCPAARNLGIMEAKGEYLAFLDADDFWTKNKLKNQLLFLESNPKTDMVFGMVEQFISPELSGEDQNRLRGELKTMPGYVAGAMLIRKETFLKVGWFDEKLELGEYIDWFSRAKDLGLTNYVSEEIVLKRRIHTSNMGINKREHLKDYTAVLRAALARKKMNK